MNQDKSNNSSELETRIKLAIDKILSGACDGGHHKQYALDQALRALVGCPLIEHHKIDHVGNSYTYQEFDQSQEYLDLLNREGLFLEKQVSDYEEEHGVDFLDGNYCIWDLGIP